MSYSISDLEQLSGVQIHTIRMWERRYNALNPLRSAGNTRFYDDNDLRRLLNIVGLSQSGMKISQVCSLSEKAMDELLQQEMEHSVAEEVHFEYYISQLISHGIGYDEFNFDRLINKCIADQGLSVTYKQVIYPLLVRLGLMWRRDHICPSHEHFISNIIRQKFYSAINELPLTNNGKPCWLLFLPEDEDHDIGLLFANYLLKSSGQRVIYLGAKIPMDSLKDAVAHNQVAHLLLFMVRNKPLVQVGAYIDQLSELFAGHQIHIAGNGKLISELRLHANMDWLQSISDFENMIKKDNYVS